MWTRRVSALAAVLSLVAVVVWAVTETSTETITYQIGPGTSPSQSISSTVTSTVSLATQYSDTLSQVRDWVSLVSKMTSVAMWYIEFDADSTSNVAQVRLISGDADTLDYYANKVARIYQMADSTAAKRITTVQVRNPHATGILTYHVVATGS